MPDGCVAGASWAAEAASEPCFGLGSAGCRRASKSAEKTPRRDFGFAVSAGPPRGAYSEIHKEDAASRLRLRGFGLKSSVAAFRRAAEIREPEAVLRLCRVRLPSLSSSSLALSK